MSDSDNREPLGATTSEFPATPKLVIPASLPLEQTDSSLEEALDHFARQLSVVKLQYIYGVPAVAAARSDIVRLFKRLRGQLEAAEKHIEIVRHLRIAALPLEELPGGNREALWSETVFTLSPELLRGIKTGP
jgi:exonuclease VII small subunit